MGEISVLQKGTHKRKIGDNIKLHAVEKLLNTCFKANRIFTYIVFTVMLKCSYNVSSRRLKCVELVWLITLESGAYV